jgi:hypothetical protein
MTPPGCELQGRVWKAGKLQQEFEFDRISDYLTEPDTLVWVDMFDPDHDALAALAQELGLNVWAVEDAVAPSERVKATVYPSHTFFTVYAVTMETPTDEPKALLTKHRISAFVLKNALVTVRLAPQWDIHEVLRRWDDLGGQQYGVSALVHGPAGRGGGRPLRRRAGTRRRDRGPGGHPVRPAETRCQHPAPQLCPAQGPGEPAPGGVADARGGQHHSTSPRRDPTGPRNWTRSTPTSTTMCCAPPSGPNRCAT